jgi:hypothetical protein
MIKGQQEATELRKLINERKMKQQDELESIYLVQKSFDEWCTQKLGSDFDTAWKAKWNEKIKGVEYGEPTEKK